MKGKTRGLTHRLTEEQFNLIKSLTTNGISAELAKAVGKAINMSFATVYRAYHFDSWESYVQWKMELAQRQKMKKNGSVTFKRVSYNVAPQVEEEVRTTTKVVNELVAIRKLLEKLVSAWEPKNPCPPEELPTEETRKTKPWFGLNKQ